MPLSPLFVCCCRAAVAAAAATNISGHYFLWRPRRPRPSVHRRSLLFSSSLFRSGDRENLPRPAAISSFNERQGGPLDGRPINERASCFDWYCLSATLSNIHSTPSPSHSVLSDLSPLSFSNGLFGGCFQDRKEERISLPSFLPALRPSLACPISPVGAAPSLNPVAVGVSGGAREGGTAARRRRSVSSGIAVYPHCGVVAQDFSLMSEWYLEIRSQPFQR